MPKNKPVIYIVGPTASGKTGFSVELAKKFNGEIVSADSMQIYQGIHIASAAPDEKEKGNIPHHLFEFLNLNESFSVAQYVELAHKTISDIHNRGKLPIVVGGTGLYISSLSQNIEFSNSDNNDIRKELEAKLEKSSLDKFYEFLLEIDPVAAEKISPTDKKRILRAIEIFYVSGKTKTECDKESKEAGPIYENLFIGLNYKNRETLYDRINKRVDIMLENGLLDEAKSTLNNSGSTSTQAIGHKELYGFLKGETSLEAATENLKMQTRRYAKRQLTWFRKNEEINWLYMDDMDNPLDIATDIVNEFLK